MPYMVNLRLVLDKVVDTLNDASFREQDFAFKRYQHLVHVASQFCHRF
jgi:hypothetical protein